MVSGLLARNGASDPGWAEVRGEQIVAVSVGTPPRTPNVMLLDESGTVQRMMRRGRWLN